MAVSRDHDEERAARIDQILEELRLNTEDLHELARQAVNRARGTVRAVQSTVGKVREEQAARKAGKRRISHVATTRRKRK
jgi:hypothetical protein